MTGNISTFYLFIRRYEDYESFKNQVDSNGNGVIQYNELKAFFDQTPQFQGMSESDTVEIWNQIDRNRMGMIAPKASNDGGLDSVEEQRIKNQVVVYGQIYEKVKDVLPSNALQSIMNKTNFDAETVYSEIVTAYIQQYGTNVPNDPDFTNKVKDSCVSGVRTLVTKSVTNLDEIQSELRNKVPNDYKLTGDLNLLSLINKAPLTFSELSSIDNYYKLVKHIVGRYMREAGIGQSWWDGHHDDVIDTNMSWEHTNPNQLSNLQKNVLTHLYETTISLNALKTCSDENYRYDFTAFSSEFNTAYTAYVNGKLSSKQNEYAGPDGLYKMASTSWKLLKDFFQTPDVGSLAQVVNTYNQAKSSCTSVNNFDNWKGISKNLCWVCGMSQENAVKFVQSDYFKTVLLQVAKALKDNGYIWEGGADHSIAHAGNEMGYGTDESPCKYASTFIEHYIQEHMTEILAAINVTDKNEVESNLFLNARNSANNVWEGEHTRSYDELKNHAMQYWNFLNKTLTSEQKEQIFGKDGLLIHISDNSYQNIPNLDNLKDCFKDAIGASGQWGWSYEKTAIILNAVHNAVVEALNTTSSTNPTGGTTTVNADKFKTYYMTNKFSFNYYSGYGNKLWAENESLPLSTSIIYAYDDDPSPNNDYVRIFNSTKDGTFNSILDNITYIKENFKIITAILRKGAIDQGVEESTAKKAEATMNNYFAAIIVTLFSAIDYNQDYYNKPTDGDTTDQYWNTITYTDGWGESHTECSTGICFRSSTTDSQINEIKDWGNLLGTASGGIYISMDRSALNDDTTFRALVTVDMKEMVKMYNKFLQH